MSLGDL